jgi:hypothetical protein
LLVPRNENVGILEKIILGIYNLSPHGKTILKNWWRG